MAAELFWYTCTGILPACMPQCCCITSVLKLLEPTVYSDCKVTNKEMGWCYWYRDEKAYGNFVLVRLTKKSWLPNSFSVWKQSEETQVFKSFCDISQIVNEGVSTKLSFVQDSTFCWLLQKCQCYHAKEICVHNWCL